MPRSLSGEDLTLFARKAVCSIRRAISLGQLDSPLPSQVLLSTSKTIEECCGRQEAVEVSLIEQWTTGLVNEIVAQLDWFSDVVGRHRGCQGNGPSANGQRHRLASTLTTSAEITPTSGGSERWSRISEFAMIKCIGLVTAVFKLNGEDAAGVFARCGLAKRMMSYFAYVPLSKVMREVLSTVLAELIGYDAVLLEQCISTCGPLLLPHNEGTEYPRIVTPEQVHLASVVSAAFRLADANGVYIESVRLGCGKGGFLANVIHTSALLARSGGEGSGKGIWLIACLAYLNLVKVVVRGCTENKVLCLCHYREDLMFAWTWAASNLQHLTPTLQVPTDTPPCVVSLAVGCEEAWILVLVDILFEIASGGSFCGVREPFFGVLEGHCIAGGGVGSSGTSTLAATFSSLTLPVNSSTVKKYAFDAADPLPTSWEEVLTGSSVRVWRLASMLFDCVLTEDGCSFIAEALSRISTKEDMADCIYRYVAFVLVLLCTATPQNARVLAVGPVVDVLLARVPHDGKCVFSYGVLSPELPGSPPHLLGMPSAEVSLALLNILTSLCTNERIMKKLMDGVGKMCSQSVSPADVDIVESFLHIIACTKFPQAVLHFPGSGCISCKINRANFTGNSIAYSCAMWLHPRCVWPDGCPLISCDYLLSNVSVVLIAVADGQLCSLVIRLCVRTEATETRIPGITFRADMWSHVVFMQRPTGFTVCVNGEEAECDLPISTHLTTLRDEEAEFSFCGVRGAPSFFGFAAGVELLDCALSKWEARELYEAGPGPLRKTELIQNLLFSVSCGNVFGNTVPSAELRKGVRHQPRNIRVLNVAAFRPPDMQETFVTHHVARWAVHTMWKADPSTESFPMVSRLCMRFLCTAMKLSETEEAIHEMVGGGVMEGLRKTLLSWNYMPVEVPALLIACTIPRGERRLMRSHDTTQSILSLLLDLIDGERLGPQDVSCLLRELSDALLFPRNVTLFQSVPGRFERLLNVSVSLPVECVDNFIVLVERLCKGPREIEQTLKFLLSEPANGTRDHVKAGLLSMFFDIACTDPSICDLIGNAFNNTGASFLILLIGGRNHSSETIRLLALRVLSLVLHSRRELHETFISSSGYEVLAAVMTSPAAATVPVGLPTFNCLFQMAFDTFRQTAVDSTQKHNPAHNGTPDCWGCCASPRDNGHSSKERRVLSAVSQGYMPCPILQQVRLTKREYSFETSWAFSCDDVSQYQPGDTHKYCHTNGCSDGVLRQPRAIYPVLGLLGRLLESMSAEFRCVTPRNCTTTGDCALASDSVAGARCRLAVGVEALPTCDVSLTSCSEEAPPDVTALQVLSYIEKIVDRPENGEMLLPFPWLTWFWGVAQHVVVPPFCMTEARSSEASAASLPPSFTAVERHIRHIVSTLAILDLGCSPSAGVVRVMIEGDQPEVLTRFAVEGIVSHFTHNQGEFSNSTEAMNILQSLNVLFSNVDRVFDSLSVTLALDIVKCISTLAVKNNSWVRMLMKECFRLFETRDRLCSVLLTTSDEFHKLDLVTLRQILEVNVYNPNALQVLFCRLADAVVGDDVNEVRVLVAMVRRFVGMSRDHLQALQSFLGSDCAPFADVILPGPSAVSSCLLGDVENVGVTDIIDWCRRNTARWDSLRERVGCSERVKGKGKEGNNSIGSSRPASLPMRSKLVTCGVSRRSEVSDQLERIMREVEVHMGGGPVVG